jgi:hypothetical protein
MPKIKAYKGSGAIIPVQDAKVVTAFQCPWTNKVFVTKKAYVAHLKVLREDRIHGAIRDRNHNRLLTNLSEQHSFQDIIMWIENHPEFFLDRAIRSGSGLGRNLETLRDKFWIKITYIDARWSESVSNSHSCPRGGKTNWGHLREDAPRGYPGWAGRIEFETSHDVGFCSEVFRYLGINTGTGGGFSCAWRYGYDLKMFATDWPNLTAARAFEKLGSLAASHVNYGLPGYFRNG